MGCVAVLRVEHPAVIEVAKDLFDGAPAVLLDGQQTAEHAERLISETPPLRRHSAAPPPPLLPAHKLLVEGVGRQRFFPGEIPGEHAEQKHTKCPHISAVVHAQTLLPAGVAQFWRRVRDGSAHSLHWRAGTPCHAKV